MIPSVTHPHLFPSPAPAAVYTEPGSLPTTPFGKLVPKASKPPKRDYVQMSSQSEAEVEELSAEQGQTVQAASVAAWREAEAQRDPNVRLNIDERGDVPGHSDRLQSDHMSRFLTIVVNEFLPIVKYTGEDGAYPEQAGRGRKAGLMGKVVGGLAADACLTSEKYGDEFEDIRKRWMDKSEKEFRRRIGEYVWTRRSALHNNLGNIGRDMALEAYGLLGYQSSSKPNDKERFVEGLSAVLENDNFIHAGELKRGPGNSMKYVREEGSDELPYAHPAIGEYVGKGFMEKDSRGVDIPREFFPDAEDQGDAPESRPRKAATIPMVAFAAAMLEHSLKEWTGGHQAKVRFENKNIQPKYVRHERALLNPDDINGRDEVLALLYEEADEWVPNVSAPVASPSTMKGTAEQAKALFAKRKAARSKK